VNFRRDSTSNQRAKGSVMNAIPLGILLCASVTIGSAQAQPACEPANSPQCRVIAACLQSSPDLTKERCPCIWGVLAAMFPNTQHSWIAEYSERASREDWNDRTSWDEQKSEMSKFMPERKVEVFVGTMMRAGEAVAHKCPLQ
jgi:hypothetical protein